MVHSLKSLTFSGISVLRRRWKLVAILAAGIALKVTIDAVAVNNETRRAVVTVTGAQIMDLPAGRIQVLDRQAGDSATSSLGAASPRDLDQSSDKNRPIVLLHCLAGSIEWWSDLLPLLAKKQRVIAIDALGHGGSEKPASDYSIERQAELVEQALRKLSIHNAIFVGHSTGAATAIAVAERARELIERLVLISEPPDDSFAGSEFITDLSLTPFLGEVLWGQATDAGIKGGLKQAFAPGFNIPDQLVASIRQMTYTSYSESTAAAESYSDERALDERLSAIELPLLAIFGAEDQIVDVGRAQATYARLRGAKTVVLPGIGHSANVESPREIAKLILDFAD